MEALESRKFFSFRKKFHSAEKPEGRQSKFRFFQAKKYFKSLGVPFDQMFFSEKKSHSAEKTVGHP